MLACSADHQINQEVISDAPICRICLEGHVDEGESLLAPCLCRGSMKYVHRNCLDHWRINGFDPKTVTHCGTCKAKFRLEESKASALGAEGEIWLQILRFLGLRVGTFLAVVLALGFFPPIALGMEAVRLHSNALLNHVMLGTTSAFLFAGGFAIMQVTCSINLLNLRDFAGGLSGGRNRGSSSLKVLLVVLAVIGAIYLLYHLVKGICEIMCAGRNMAVLNAQHANCAMRQRIVQRYRVISLESATDVNVTLDSHMNMRTS